MEKQVSTVFKSVIRHLEKTQPHFYFIPKAYKQQLGYPLKCLDDPSNPQTYLEMISIGYQTVLTEKDHELCRLLLLNQKLQVVYDRWFLPQHPLVDCLRKITGITKELLQTNATKSYDEASQKEVMKIFENKIVVGHDLANILQILGISHHAFIDTLHICPHNFGLPQKSSLKQLAMSLLRKPIQWDRHDPKQDAVTVLQIIQKHLKQGKGVMQDVPMQQKRPEQYKDIWEIVEDAELDRKKIVGLFLRGSRALGLEMNIEGYKSDWDYVCIYDTWSTINGKLIKLTEIDITIYDLNSFNNYIHNENDISYLELFFIPKECQFINQLKFPEINIQKLRESLGFHLSKCKMKIQRFKPDPTKRWKILKTVHMKIRFMDYFVQLFDYGCIKDVKRMNHLWDQFKEEYIQSGNFQRTLINCNAKANEHMEQVRQRYQTRRKLGLNQLPYETQLKKGRSKQTSKHQNNYLKEEFQLEDHDESSPSQKKPNPIHSKLHIVQEVRQHGFNNIDKYKIKMKRGVRHPNLIEFRYLISASFKNPICRETRGIILDENRNYEVVALPYFKFFDYNDPKYSQLNEFDFTKYRIYEKFDGSISFIYFYGGEWQVASASVPDGESGYCYGKKETTTEFRKEFWRIFNDLKFKMPLPEDQNKTFVFELMSVNHIIVCQRSKDQLVLHGARDIDTLEEHDPLIYQQKYGWTVSKPLELELKDPLNPIPEIVEITEKLDPLKQEGFILCDWKYTRLKVKSSSYLKVGWLGELNLTKNKDPPRYILINIVLAGEAELFAQYCPEWRPVIEDFMTKIYKFNQFVLKQYDAVKELDKRQFAEEVKKKDKSIQTFLFLLRQDYDLWKGRVQNFMDPKKFSNVLMNFNFNDI